MKPNPQSLWTSAVEDRNADDRIERLAQVHPTETGQAVPLAKNAIDVTVVCEDPVGPDDARIPGHHVDPAARVALGAEAYFALSMDGGFRPDSGRSRGHPCRTGLRPSDPFGMARQNVSCGRSSPVQCPFGNSRNQLDTVPPGVAKKASNPPRLREKQMPRPHSYATGSRSSLRSCATRKNADKSLT
jgi:hypothetical protein